MENPCTLFTTKHNCLGDEATIVSQRRIRSSKTLDGEEDTQILSPKARDVRHCETKENFSSRELNVTRRNWWSLPADEAILYHIFYLNLSINLLVILVEF